MAQPFDLAEQSSDVIHFRQVPALQTEARPHGLSRTIPQFTDVSPAELQLQLKRLELEHEREREERQEREREREQDIRRLELEQEREREERQFQLRKLELEMSRDAASSSQPAAPHSPRAPPFRVEAAVKLVPKFSEHDIETFLISFEKVAELNNFPEDKYAAILQAHLTGKALKVFTELSVGECRDYATLKAALLQAYSVVPEVYRKRFRNLSRHSTETYSEFAFRLGTQFTRWLESKGAYSDVELLRDLVQREQFLSNLDSDLRIWLIDQKPKTLSEAARLADQYVAVRKAERPARGHDSNTKGHDYYTKGHGFKPKSFGDSGRGNFNAGAQKNGSFHRDTTGPEGNKSSYTSANSKANSTRTEKPNVFCYYCKNPGHILPNCPKRRQKHESKDTPVQLVSTLTSSDTQGHRVTAVVSKSQKVDPRYEGHCSLVTLVRPDLSRHIIRALRDTGALQSLLSEQSVSDCDYESTGEFRMIRGVTGETVSVPLVRVTLQSSLCSGDVLCGLATSLPSGIDMLIGNDLCPSLSAVDVAVVTRSQTAALRRDFELQNLTETDPLVFFSG